MTELYVLCIKDIKHHGNNVAFRKGHVYIANRIDDGSNGISSKYNIISDYHETIETFPKNYFNINFKIMFPVMKNLG
jgi:hypothetical protein